MSRIGKLPVHLGKGVDCKIVDGNIIVKGPKGEVTMHVLPMVGRHQGRCCALHAVE